MSSDGFAHVHRHGYRQLFHQGTLPIGDGTIRDRGCITAVSISRDPSRAALRLKGLAPAHRLHLAVHRFLREIRILPWGQEAAVVQADIRYHLVSNGIAIGEMDMMIAAHAIALGATLITNNGRQFARLAPALEVENWVSEDE